MDTLEKIETLKARLTGLDDPHITQEEKELRMEGRDWPAHAYTMIGMARLTNVQHCMEEVLRRGVPGDMVETGVWRGGTTIFMRAVLQEHNCEDRTVWVVDSFCGLPEPDTDRYPQDAESTLHQEQELAIDVETVRGHFAEFDLLDTQVQLLEGYFEDTLANPPMEQIAVLRLDGDMYQSTIEVLTSLYDRVSPGGYIIVDDYGAIEGCKQAVQDFRRDRGITTPMIPIDWTGVYWEK